jgi:hypothetical protein
MNSIGVMDARDEASILFYQHRINPHERLKFLQFAISQGEGNLIVGQILYDLLDYANEQRHKDGRRDTSEASGKIELITLANQHLLKTIEHCRSEQLSGGTVNPTKLAEYLECWVEIAFVD